MAVISYCSKEDYAFKRAKLTWADYADAFDYPTEDGLEDMLQEATALMNVEMGRSEDNNLTTHPTFCRNLCYRMVRLMEQEELGEAEGDYNRFIPKDYMFERDRNKLHRFARETGSLKLGGVTSG